jgi:hypothetical protein
MRTQAQVIELAKCSTKHIAANPHRLLPHVAIDVQSLQDGWCALVNRTSCP